MESHYMISDLGGPSISLDEDPKSVDFLIDLEL